jgi:hypothetical protein
MAWNGNRSLMAVSAAVYGNNFETEVVVVHACLLDVFV